MEIYDPRYCADIGDGFLVKWATPSECVAYGVLSDTVFRRTADSPLRDLNAVAVREWTNGHPYTDHTDIAVVVDADDHVVAGAILLRQSMDYAGVQLGVGRPEGVVCAAEHRNRGFVRHLFRLLHAKSHARGDHLQAITGIPYFYRQLGYAYAIAFDGQAIVSFEHIAGISSTAVPMTLRKARPDEYHEFVALYDADRLGRGLLCTTPLERSYFQHLTGVSTQAFIIDPYFMVSDKGEILGYTLLHRAQYDGHIAVLGAGLRRDKSWYQLLPGFFAALTAHQPMVQMTNPAIASLSGINFILDTEHPLLTQLQYGTTVRTVAPYSWYIRVDDYERFFESVRPIIEARLRRSSMRGYTGSVTVALYGSAYRLVWEAGSLTTVSAVSLPMMGSGADAGYPADAFAMQVFGRKSYREIKHWHHEAWASHTAEQLLSILFPTGSSWFLWLN
ncbi:MAG: hypothetical protein RLZZ297_1292 [Chloroflexota bacterium]|jgi:hypothetical protein